MTNHHRQQLFHWISAGRDSELRQLGKPIRGRLDDQTRREYVQHLVGSLQNGLWMRDQLNSEVFTHHPEDPALNLGITCFTEWSLGESTGHTERYGRLGFGFPKRWVIARGGQPVTYFRDVKDGVFATAVRDLQKSGADADRRRLNHRRFGQRGGRALSG